MDRPMLKASFVILAPLNSRQTRDARTVYSKNSHIARAAFAALDRE